MDKKLEARRKKALDEADIAYYDRASPHYRDNDRYSWAVKTINQEFDKEAQLNARRGQ
jgi:hypothetical protein